MAVSGAVGPLLDQVLQRVRDPHGTGINRDLLRLLVSHSQRVLNVKMNLVVTTETLSTEAARLIYPIHAMLPHSAHVLCVQDSGNDLDYVRDWRTLANFKTGWFREVAPQHRVWSIIGRDLLVVYPAKDYPSTVDVISVKLIDDMNDDGTELEILDTEHRPTRT